MPLLVNSRRRVARRGRLALQASGPLEFVKEMDGVGTGAVGKSSRTTEEHARELLQLWAEFVIKQGDVSSIVFLFISSDWLLCTTNDSLHRHL